MECDLPRSFLIALLLRGEEVIAPTGQTVSQPGDQWIAIASPEDIRKIRSNL